MNDKKPEDTDVYRTAINAKLDRWCGPGVEHRIAPGEPKESCLSVRPHLRGVDTDSQLQMPPIGTKMPDPAGLNTIDTWIKSLKP